MKKTAIVLATLLLGTGVEADRKDVADCERQVVDQSYPCMRTLAELRSLRTALEAYLIDNGSLPEGLSNGDAIAALIEPVYIRKAVTEDAWGTPFRIRRSADGRSFVLASAGSDRTFDEESWSRPGLLEDSAEDACVGTSHENDREWAIQK